MYLFKKENKQHSLKKKHNPLLCVCVYKLTSYLYMHMPQWLQLIPMISIHMAWSRKEYPAW